MKNFHQAVLLKDFLKEHPEHADTYRSDGCTAVEIIWVSQDRRALMQRYAEKFGYRYDELHPDPDNDTYFPATVDTNYLEAWVLAPAYDGTDRLVIRTYEDDEDIFITDEELEAIIVSGVDPASTAGRRGGKVNVDHNGNEVIFAKELRPGDTIIEEFAGDPSHPHPLLFLVLAIVPVDEWWLEITSLLPPPNAIEVFRVGQDFYFTRIKRDDAT